MAYTTASGTSTTVAVAYSEISGLPTIKQDAMLRMAERFVLRYAPPPDPITDGYESAASDAELHVFNYLANTEGLLSSENIEGIASSYIDQDKVRAMVVAITAGYADTASQGVAYLETFVG